MNVENSKDNNIEDVVDTTPLSDVRRTRTRSTGRPPSQHFLKENALQRCISLDCDDLSTEEQESLTKVKETPAEENNLILKNVVTEVIQKTKVDEETIVDGKSNLVRRTSLATTIIQPKRVIKEDIPWMNEFRKKREHKRSLLDDEKKNIEDFVKNDEINRKTRATTFESRKFTSYLPVSKNEEEIKSEKSVDINKKSEDIKTIEESFIGRSRMVTNESNFTKHTTSSSISEIHHQFATTTSTTSTTESASSKQNIAKKINIESHTKTPIELPTVNIKETDSNKIETSNAEIMITNSPKVDHQISAPKLPMLVQNPTDDIENKIEEKKSSNIQNKELIAKIKTFEETCNKQLKNIRNEVKVLHRELASLSEFVSEFVKTVEHDIASINNSN